MKNLKEKFNIKTLSIILILLLPFLDIYKSTVGNRIEILGFSLVEIMNFAYTFILFVLMIILKKKNKESISNWKFIALVGIVISIYLVGHLINISFFNEELINTAKINFFIELYHIAKSYILPIILLFTFYKINLPAKQLLKVLSYMSFFISCVIIFTNIFKVSYLAYGSDYANDRTIEGSIFEWGEKLANCEDINLYTSKGWFYSANQMSAILSGLSLISALFALKENKFIYYFLLLCDCIALLMLSTKTALLAIFLSTFIIFVYALYRYIITKENVLKAKSIFSCCAIALIMIAIFFNSPIRFKLFGYIDKITDNRSSITVAVGDKEEEPETIIDEKTEEIKIENSNADNNEKEKIMNLLEQSSTSFGIPNEYTHLYPVNKNTDFWYELIQRPTSEVSNYRTVKYLIYQDVLKNNNNNFWDKIFGIGYTSNFPELERDVINQNILYGYIGTLIFVIPFFVILGYCIIKIITNLKKNIEIENYALLIASAYMMMASLYSGHVFGMFIPSAILAIILASLLSNLTNNKDEINKKKVTFLLLHLGYGGTETSNINIANSICDDYEVELISFYNLEENQTKNLKDNISIKYLYNGGPNKVELKKAIEGKNIFNMLKEGIKALDILVKKKYLIKKEILNSNSGIIISSRYSFSKLLGKYGNKECIKIAQEHNHHNNDKKYIKKIIGSLKNIDYFMPVSLELTNFYRKKIHNQKTKTYYIPHFLEYFPEKCSNLAEKQIVSIGRLDPIKGFLDLIDIFKELEQHASDWILNIIGGGDQYDELQKKIYDTGLEKKVFLLGQKNREEINKILSKSSIYVMTSYSESFGLVLLEAESFGIPLIAFDSAQGAKEIIKDSENGFLISKREKKEMINKILDLVNNPQLRNDLGHTGRELSKNYKKEKIQEKWKVFFNEILK